MHPCPAAEQQVDAERLLEAVQSALDVDGERLLGDDERITISEHGRAARIAGDH